jgi:shikimate kinase
VPDPPRRVVLVGFMGAGKSTVGPLVAARLGWAFLDMDPHIEARAGHTIAEIFRDRGEPAFRALERAVAEEVGRRSRLVVAAGGGAFAQPDTREALRQDALTVWLRCEISTIEARIPADGRRPLAANRDIMRALLAERDPSYQLADVAVEASSGTPESVADEVVRRVRARGIEDRETAG